MLELRELVKHYQVGDSEPVRAVDGVSLAVAPGELVVLHGPSGSGKSTLLMMIAALLRPDSGTVRVGGREISMLSRGESARYRRSDLGYVRQSVDLIPGVSARDNAALKLFATMRRRDAHRKVVPLLDLLGLGPRIDHLPDQLSMGERQRVMIARALSTEPRLLLADEPTGSLDSARGREVLTLLRSLSREHHVAILLVTHDPQAAAFGDRVHTLRDGRLIDHPIAGEPSIPATAP